MENYTGNNDDKRESRYLLPHNICRHYTAIVTKHTLPNFILTWILDENEEENEKTYLKINLNI